VIPEYAFAINFFDNSMLTSNSGTLLLLYQLPNSSPFIIGIRGSYTSANSDNSYYATPNATPNYNYFYRTLNSTNIALSGGVTLRASKDFRNNILLNIQTPISGSYGTSCNSTASGTNCVNQNNPLSGFGIGIENQLLYGITKEFSIGLTTGVWLNEFNLGNYSATANGTPYNTTQSSAGAQPFIGLVLSYQVF
jgi:hypothetical protein